MLAVQERPVGEPSSPPLTLSHSTTTVPLNRAGRRGGRRGCACGSRLVSTTFAVAVVPRSCVRVGGPGEEVLGLARSRARRDRAAMPADERSVAAGDRPFDRWLGMRRHRARPGRRDGHAAKDLNRRDPLRVSSYALSTRLQRGRCPPDAAQHRRADLLADDAAEPPREPRVAPPSRTRCVAPRARLAGGTRRRR